MWFAEFEFNGLNAPIGKIANECNISISTYPVSISKLKNKLLIYFVANIYGTEENKSKAIKLMKKHSRVHFLERNDDFVVVLFEEPKDTEPIYQHNLVHIKPIFISPSGKEIWSIGSNEKEHLMDFNKTLYKIRKAKLKFIKNKKINNISIVQINPDLTTKQKNAIKLAIEEGYYNVPRKTDVQTLAKKSKLSFSTFQAHLRKAEGKLIPYSFSKLD